LSDIAKYLMTRPLCDSCASCLCCDLWHTVWAWWCQRRFQCFSAFL